MLQYMRDALVCLRTWSEEEDTLVKGPRQVKRKNTLEKGNESR